MSNTRLYGIVTLTVLILVGLSVGLQWRISTPEAAESDGRTGSEPDHVILNPVFRGMDEKGENYRMRADRMTLYTHIDRVHLDSPRIVQHLGSSPPRYISADSAWWNRRTSEVLLTGNVQMTEGQSESDADTYMGERMVILLEEDGG